MYFHPTLKLCEIPSFLTAWLTNKAFPERKKKEQKKNKKNDNTTNSVQLGWSWD
jgi:hypothetical protein